MTPATSLSLTSSLLLPTYFALADEDDEDDDDEDAPLPDSATGPTDDPSDAPFCSLRLLACLKRARASGFFWRLDMSVLNGRVKRQGRDTSHRAKSFPGEGASIIFEFRRAPVFFVSNTRCPGGAV